MFVASTTILIAFSLAVVDALGVLLVVFGTRTRYRPGGWIAGGRVLIGIGVVLLLVPLGLLVDGAITNP